MKNKNGIVIALIMILSSFVIYLTLTTISTKETMDTINKAKEEANKSEILAIKEALNLHIEISKMGYSNYESMEDICNNVIEILPNIVDYDTENYDVKCNITNESENTIYTFEFKNIKNNTKFNIKCTNESCLD